MKYRWEVINWLIQRLKYRSYLEIGVKDGVCFNRVNLNADSDRKFGIDIKPLIMAHYIYAMSSDEYFAETLATFDIIFIDGDHHEEQVDRDIQNALKCLAPNGTIVMHDCSPPDEKYANEERGEKQVLWSGTAYRSFLKLRRVVPYLSMFVVDVDWGCGIIQRGKQELINIPENFSWEWFDKNRKESLNLISVEEFKNR